MLSKQWDSIFCVSKILYVGVVVVIVCLAPILVNSKRVTFGRLFSFIMISLDDSVVFFRRESVRDRGHVNRV